MIRQRLKYKIKLFDQKMLLVNWWLPIARHEDEWDRLVNNEARRSIDGHENGVRWADAIELSEQLNTIAYEDDQQKDKVKIKRMQEIVDQEMELALKEGQTIIRGRKRRPLQVIKPDPKHQSKR